MLCELIQRLLGKTGTRLSANPSTSSAHPVNQYGVVSPLQLEEVNLEEFSIQFLSISSTQPHWRQIVSSPDHYGQTFAHISVTLGYFQLLQHLFKWEIDINTTDKMGLTALHYAYLFKQEECARFLIHSGADQCILDGLGRSPSDLNPSLGAVLHSVMDIDDNRRANHALPIEGNLEVQEETKMSNTKAFLVRQWAQQVEFAIMNAVISSNIQSSDILCPTDASTAPGIDSTDEKIHRAVHHQSPSSSVHSSQGVSPTVAPEEAKTQVGITFGSDIIPPLTETSLQTNINRPSHTVSRAPIVPEAKMSSGRQKLKELQERTRWFTYTIAEPQRTGSISDTEAAQEWITYCNVQTHNQLIRIDGEKSGSKSGAEEKAAEFAFFWINSQNLF